MLGENKNLKDIHQDSKTNLGISVTDNSFSISYTKTHKLITALYMVTDVIDKEEPIRAKLRVLGTGIISDMHSVPTNAVIKIAETVSFLNIASSMNFISEMNCTILKKEFIELKASIQENIDMKPTWLADFFLRPHHILDENKYQKNSPENSIGHGKSTKRQTSTRIGVQKGSTLMQALSDKILSGVGHPTVSTHSFDTLKKQRRDDLVNVIKILGGSATIKDIKDKVKVAPEQSNALFSSSEKTLQRELISMVKDNVLNKTGAKRWSRYFLKLGSST